MQPQPSTQVSTELSPTDTSRRDRSSGARRGSEDVVAAQQTVPCDLWCFISGEDSVDKDMIRKSLRARKTLESVAKTKSFTGIYSEWLCFVRVQFFLDIIKHACLQKSPPPWKKIQNPQNFEMLAEKNLTYEHKTSCNISYISNCSTWIWAYLYVRGWRLQQPRPITVLLTMKEPQQKQSSLADTDWAVSEPQQETTLDLVQHQQRRARRVKRRSSWSQRKWGSS